MTYRINIQLDENEFEALRTASQTQMRHPRDQARYILRSVLFGDPPPARIATNEKSAVRVYQTSGALIPTNR